MSVDTEAGRLKTEAGEPGWEVDPDDDWGVAVIATVGRQLRLRREAVGMRVPEFAKAVGYGEDLVYKIEGGKRIPRQEYLDKADEVLGADGLISAAWEDVKKVRYPKKVRALAKMEAKAVEIGVYECSNIHGLLQTPEHARALLDPSTNGHPSCPRFRPRRGDAAPQCRRHNGAATAVRTSAGDGEVVQRHASGDVAGQRAAPRHERQDRVAEVRGRHGLRGSRWPSSNDCWEKHDPQVHSR